MGIIGGWFLYENTVDTVYDQKKNRIFMASNLIIATFATGVMQSHVGSSMHTGVIVMSAGCYTAVGSLWYHI
jgi:hypothetical protein